MAAPSVKSADFWHKNAELLNLAGELSWNFPEQKSGSLAIIGGNSSNFSTEVKVSEFVNLHFPFLKTVDNFFPDSLKSKLPSLGNLKFFESSESGSFRRSPDFRSSLDGYEFALLLGDFSKNSETALAAAELLKFNPEVPTLLTRDAVDLLAEDAENFIERGNITLVASLVQLQKLFRAVYYPKMLLLSSPIFPIIETLHKFTLSYPVSILTFHEGQVICAHGGKVLSVDIEKTSYSPITLWSGEVAAKIVMFKMFNPGKPLDALVAGLTYKS